MNKFDLRKYFNFNILLKEEKELLFVRIPNIDKFNNEKEVQEILGDERFTQSPPLDYSLTRYKEEKQLKFIQDEKGEFFSFIPYGKIGIFIDLLHEKNITYTLTSATDYEKEN